MGTAHSPNIKKHAVQLAYSLPCLMHSAGQSGWPFVLVHRAIVPSGWGWVQTNELGPDPGQRKTLKKASSASGPENALHFGFEATGRMQTFALRKRLSQLLVACGDS